MNSFNTKQSRWNQKNPHLVLSALQILLLLLCDGLNFLLCFGSHGEKLISSICYTFFVLLKQPEEHKVLSLM